MRKRKARPKIREKKRTKAHYEKLTELIAENRSRFVKI